MKFLLAIWMSYHACAAPPAPVAEVCGRGFWGIGGVSRFLPTWLMGAKPAPDQAPSAPAVASAPVASAPEPWLLKRWSLDAVKDDYYNLHALGLRPEFAEFYRKLGIEIVPPDQVRVPRAKALNDKLPEVGSSFKIEEVGGKIAFDPWMKLMADGKFPVGDKHDMMTHAMAIFLMPSELAGTYRGSLKLFMAMRDEPSLPAPVKDYVREQLGNLGKGFELFTYSVAKTLTENPASKMDYAALARDYGNLVAFPAHQPTGVPVRIREMKAELRRRRVEMKLSTEDLTRIEARLDGILTALKAEDPMYAIELTRPEIVAAVRSHYDENVRVPR